MNCPRCAVALLGQPVCAGCGLILWGAGAGGVVAPGMMPGPPVGQVPLLPPPMMAPGVP